MTKECATPVAAVVDARVPVFLERGTLFLGSVRLLFVGLGSVVVDSDCHEVDYLATISTLWRAALTIAVVHICVLCGVVTIEIVVVEVAQISTPKSPALPIAHPFGPSLGPGLFRQYFLYLEYELQWQSSDVYVVASPEQVTQA